MHSHEDIIYREELERLAGGDRMLQIVHTLTRTQPPGWTGYGRRIDTELSGEVAWSRREQPQAFICGPLQFVETAAELLSFGYEPTRMKTERFGPYRLHNL